MPSADELKMRRDGFLGFGPKEWDPCYVSPKRLPRPGQRLWNILRGDDGLPSSMQWCGDVPEDFDPVKEAEKIRHERREARNA